MHSDLNSDFSSQSNLTPLIIAASAGKTQVVRILLAKGADINAVNSDGHSALQYAASKNHTEVNACVLLYYKTYPLVGVGFSF